MNNKQLFMVMLLMQVFSAHIFSSQKFIRDEQGDSATHHLNESRADLRIGAGMIALGFLQLWAAYDENDNDQRWRYLFAAATSGVVGTVSLSRSMNSYQLFQGARVREDRLWDSVNKPGEMPLLKVVVQ